MIATRLLPIPDNTDVTTFEILSNGEPVPLGTPIYSIEVCREVNRIPTATICLSDGDASNGEWELSSGDFFVPGNEIEILAGYRSENETIFIGVVTRQGLKARNGRLALEVECKDLAVQMTTVRRSRQFVDQTDADAITTVLDEYQLTGDIAGPDVQLPEIVQYDCTDWDFVLSRVEANGQVLAAVDGAVNVFTPAMDTEPVAVLQLGANVIELDAEIEARTQAGSVTAEVWDPANQATITLDAADPGWTTVGNLDPVAMSEAVAADQLLLRHPGPLPPDEAQAWADKCLLRSRMAFIRGRVRSQGFGQATPGVLVELAGLGDRFNGPVWVSGVRHEISHGSWISDIQFGLDQESLTERFDVQAPAASGLLGGVSGLHTGTITEIADDPAGEARVRVRIPLVDGEGEGVWARIATLDAGADRGTFFLPEVDDEVLVGFLNDDPRHPVVLGMLHSSAKAPPFEASSDNPEKGFVSRSGIRLVFDDDAVKLTIETPGGASLVIDDDGGEVSLADQNGNSLTLSSSGIEIASAGEVVVNASTDLKMESGTNLEAKAGVQLLAEGSAGAEVSSSGVTVIKGSLVQIN